jgi:hypothetical protein
VFKTVLKEVIEEPAAKLRALALAASSSTWNEVIGLDPFAEFEPTN